MILPLMWQIITDKCLDVLFDPITSILEVSTKYGLHSGSQINTITLLRSESGARQYITLTSVIFERITDGNLYVFNSTWCTSVSCVMKMANEYAVSLLAEALSNEKTPMPPYRTDGDRLIFDEMLTEERIMIEADSITHLVLD